MFPQWLIRICVWIILRDSLWHRYNPRDHFWYQPELWERGILP